MKNIRFLIDENAPRIIASQLLRLRSEIQIRVVGDEFAPPRGALDPEILHWLTQESYSLVTQNRKSMPIHLKNHLAKGHHVPGIFTLKHKAPIGQAIETLLLIWQASEPNEHQDCIVFIPF